MTRIKLIKFILILVALTSLGVLFFNRVRIRTLFDAWRAPALPEAREFRDTSFQPKADQPLAGKFQDKEKESPIQLPVTNNQLPDSYNLAVPFQPQAPFANWAMPYQEACEEAALIMADRFFKGQTELSADQMDKAIKELVAWEEKRFGYYQDTTADEVAIIAKEYFGLNAVVDTNVTVDNIKRQIAGNKLVLVPAAGKILPNPYFRAGGPLYHMLVIRGYTPDRFITNDPGTKRGKEFTYHYNDLLNAVHDWPSYAKATDGKPGEADMLAGRKVMIVVN